MINEMEYDNYNFCEMSSLSIVQKYLLTTQREFWAKMFSVQYCLDEIV